MYSTCHVAMYSTCHVAMYSTCHVAMYSTYHVTLRPVRVTMLQCKKTISNTYSQFMFVASVMQHAVRACAILPSVACPTVPYFSTLSHKRHDFQQKKSNWTQNVWYFADRASQYIYLNISQLDALNFIMSLFHASTCFEHMCSSSGGQNCTIQPLVSSHL